MENVKVNWGAIKVLIMGKEVDIESLEYGNTVYVGVPINSLPTEDKQEGEK